MLDRGFVKLHRSILSWEWYDSPDTMRLFLHLLLTVNYEPKKWRGTVIDRGQRVCSLATLAKETRLSVRTVRTCLERLISTNELTRQANPQYTVITINNYAKYQTPTNEVTNERQTTDKPTTNDRQQLKKDKESKKVKEVYPTDIDSAKPQDVMEAFNRICVSLPSVKKLTDTRCKHINAKHASLEEFETVFRSAEQSDFLSGRSGKWTGCGFDWLINPTNWQKVLEGNYSKAGKEKNPALDYDQKRYTEADLAHIFVNLEG